MSAELPALVVTLPARTIADARKQMEEARESGASFFEVRFDRFSEGELGRVSELFPSGSPLLATLRSAAEGGEGPDDPERRARILTELARQPFRWIDVELARDTAVARSLSRPGRLGLIVSTFSPVPLRESEWRSLLREAVPEASIRKVVAPASVA